MMGAPAPAVKLLGADSASRDKPPAWAFPAPLGNCIQSHYPSSPLTASPLGPVAPAPGSLLGGTQGGWVSLQQAAVLGAAGARGACGCHGACLHVHLPGEEYIEQRVRAGTRGQE